MSPLWTMHLPCHLMSVAVSKSCWLHASAKTWTPHNPALIHAVESCRLHYKRSLAQHKATVRARRSAVYMDLCREKSQSAELYLARCLRKPSPGLMDCMVSESGDVLQCTFKRANVSPWWLLPLTSLWHLSGNPHISHMARFSLIAKRLLTVNGGFPSSSIWHNILLSPVSGVLLMTF